MKRALIVIFVNKCSKEINKYHTLQDETGETLSGDEKPRDSNSLRSDSHHQNDEDLNEVVVVHNNGTEPINLDSEVCTLSVKSHHPWNAREIILSTGLQ